ncbi:hypothetical protein QEH52_04350 [Coraliomargarita sp. SDUM461003]|uniref:Uncharacterized protein n=1 Tax=Thalassobacterium maritimum TaxID=3041265 RepID=A0ABU1ARE2_9BACT|nr:hypothetical protein [Coraliomargarita sp. SDUM461003]MDQ8206727.1 hypothetical protein [Coraliomargarita sp. SDUM461003]
MIKDTQQVSSRLSAIKRGAVVAAIIALGAFASACSSQSEAGSALSDAQAWQMPSVAEEVHLSWIELPPQMQVFRPMDIHLEGYREDSTRLAFRSQQWGMLLDPRGLTIEQFTLSHADDPIADTLDYSGMASRWSTSELKLEAEVDGHHYRAVGGALPESAKTGNTSPVHIVESGPWFQHVAIYDLELVAADGSKLPAKSWLEIRAWGDRSTFEWFVEAEVPAQPELSIQLRADALDVNQSIQVSGAHAVLALSMDNKAVAPIPTPAPVQIAVVARNEYTPSDPTVAYSELSDAWEVTIPKQDWKNGTGAAFNEAYLDRISRFDLKLENPTDQPQEISLRFIHDYHPIAGYVPMLLDTDGRQTGIPIQNSKNWHSLPNKPYPYEGTWINQTARLTLAPYAEVELQYAIVHALWQGVPASSAAQLSLVGWGYNGFWTQMALGSWGETLCLQPGRSMRRAFITDVRPFEMLSNKDLKYDWTTNVGGGDIAKIVDSEGKLITWEGTVREFEMIGPNLSHVRVRERSADERMRLQIDTYLPRSNSINRSYFKVKLDVLADVAFSELALFQLGSDYYNEVESRQIAWGDQSGLSEIASPPAAEWGRVMEPQRLSDAQPWVSLFDNDPNTKRRGRGNRGMVVRAFNASLSGQTLTQPWLQSERTMTFLNAELTLDPELMQFKAGDRIEFTVELDVFPLTADSYYGSNAGLRERLSASADSWQLTAYEAKQQQIKINGQAQVFPATYAVQSAGSSQSFTVESLSSMDTVRITGLGQPGSWQIAEQFEGGALALGARFTVEKDPQVNYDPSTQSWTAVLSLVFPEGVRERKFMLMQQ